MRDETNEDLDAVLMALDPDGLREALRRTLLEADEPLRHRLRQRLREAALQSGGGWSPPAPRADEVEAALVFAHRARQSGDAAPKDFDAALEVGRRATAACDHDTALGLFEALLPLLLAGEVDLGQREEVNEVLLSELDACVACFMVATYCTIERVDQRPRALLAILQRYQPLTSVMRPLAAMERQVSRPLPAFEEFLPLWYDVVRVDARGGVERGWRTDELSWRREATVRAYGVAGLAALARATRCGDDLRAWCHSLAEQGDRAATLAAYDEALELVSDGELARATLADGAALAAVSIGGTDLGDRLLRAWTHGPTLQRLRRWLGAAADPAQLLEWAKQAHLRCRAANERQLAFLELLLGDLASAAGRLVSAKALGWSSSEHPGHLIVASLPGLFGRALDGLDPFMPSAALAAANDALRLDELGLDVMHPSVGGAQLAEPSCAALLISAGAPALCDARGRAIFVAALRRAAERRLEAIVEMKRRRQYGHAASVAALVVQLDPTPENHRWYTGLQARYHRLPALRADLADALGAR